VDSSSGNTAVGLALVGRAKGYAVELYMPGSVNAERQALCRAYGASIVFTDPLLGSDGALEEVRRRVAADPGRYFYADQYRNPRQPARPLPDDGPRDLGADGRARHALRGGTRHDGHHRRHRAVPPREEPRVRVVAVEPDHEMHGLEGLKHLPSAIVPEIYDPAAHDDKVTASTEAAYAMCAQVLHDHGPARRALRRRGAVGRARDRPAVALAVVVALLPDSGERYLSGQAAR
jgi:cysteine synthase B